MNIINLVNEILASEENDEVCEEALRKVETVAQLHRFSSVLGHEVLVELAKLQITVGWLSALFQRLNYIAAFDERVGIEFLVEMMAYDKERRWYDENKIQELAALIAAIHPADYLLSMIRSQIGKTGYTDPFLYMVHELIIQGKEYSSNDVVTDWAQKEMQRTRHVLVPLPLYRTQLERTVDVPSVDKTTGPQYPSVYTLQPSKSGERMPASSQSIMATDITDWKMQHRTRCLFRGWLEESNGRLEIRRYHSTQLQSDSNVSPALLASLRLPSLAGADLDSISVYKVSPEWAFRLLFRAFAGGCAYFRGHYGAIGRLRTWEMLSVLLGEKEDLRIQEIEKRTYQASWFVFTAQSDWFFRHAPYNIGLIVLDRQLGWFTILAVTDED